MNANIFRHEFLSRLKSVAIWCGAMSFLLIFYYAMFPIFSENAALMNQFLANYPQELRVAFGMDGMDLSTVLGFLSFVFVFVQLCLAIQASNMGFGLVSIEENELTADFLLSKPVSRTQVLNSKLAAALAGLVLTNAVVWIASFTGIELFRGERAYDASLLTLILSSTLLFQLCFLCFGLVISLLVKRVRSVTPFGLGLGFGAYILNAFSGVFGDVALELITPFKHFNIPDMILNEGFDLPLVGLNLAASLLALAVSYWLYVRRDIPAVS
jgi:ABC-2 type transport system permease protein